MASVSGKGKGRGGMLTPTKRYKKHQEFLKYHNRMRYLNGARAKGSSNGRSE